MASPCRNHQKRRSFSLATAAILAAGLLSPATAAAGDAVAFQRTVKRTCNAELCDLSMFKPGKFERAEIVSVSCQVVTWNDAELYRLSLVNTKTGDEDYLVPALVSTPSTTTRYVANHTTLLIAERRQKLGIAAVATGGTIAAIACKIAGYVETLD